MMALGDLLYPTGCVGCDRPVRGGLCRRCAEMIPKLGPCTCAFCGGPVRVPSSRCDDCRGRGHRFDAARQAVQFTSTIRVAIHRYKYRSERCLSESLALLLLDCVKAPDEGVLTWVPPQRDRVRKRGFDHAKLLAQTLGTVLGRPAEAALTRIRSTRPQIDLEPQDRRRNLVGAFAATGPVTGKVLVVDDVFTTGGTATEAARALKAAGALYVEVLCVARALPALPRGAAAPVEGFETTRSGR